MKKKSMKNIRTIINTVDARTPTVCRVQGNYDSLHTMSYEQACEEILFRNFSEWME